MVKNIEEIKEKILSYIKERGPSLPVHLTKVTSMNLTFTSAILSELFKEKKLKMSNLQIGSSSLYYLPGQEEMLENFVNNLKPQEKEAFLKLKENKILEDEKQDPVTRVALRNIKDFAIPIKKGEKLFWKYYLLPENKAIEALEGSEESIAVGYEKIIGQSIFEDIKKEGLMPNEKTEELIKKTIENLLNQIKEQQESKEKKEEVPSEKIEFKIEKSEEIKKEEKTPEKRKIKSIKKQELLNKLKKKLEERGFLFEQIIKETKSVIILSSKKENQNVLVFAFDKKSIDEKEIISLYKKFFDEKKYSFFVTITKSTKSQKFIDKKKFYEKFSENILLEDIKIFK
ncbi:MAG: hypothetical protein QW273_03935 [Candidatus Pacearchaeota archaeon]